MTSKHGTNPSNCRQDVYTAHGDGNLGEHSRTLPTIGMEKKTWGEDISCLGKPLLLVLLFLLHLHNKLVESHIKGMDANCARNTSKTFLFLDDCRFTCSYKEYYGETPPLPHTGEVLQSCGQHHNGRLTLVQAKSRTLLCLQGCPSVAIPTFLPDPHSGTSETTHVFPYL